MSPKPKLKIHPSSAKGDFYVENGCCTRCGVPETLAPDLIGGSAGKSEHCYWKKQPETPDEIDRAIAILATQELGCHRYAGVDREILRRIDPENCDYPSAVAGLKGNFFSRLRKLFKAR